MDISSLDITFLLIFIIFVTIGIIRGFIKEISALLVWVLSSVLAWFFAESVSTFFGFIGGSMGSVVGEKFVRAVNLCLQEKIPLICFSASGGARMQEALLSLMQMAKTSAALTRLNGARIPYISVLTDPTMGGVSASLAMLGDIIVAEPKALIGFAGPRVIEQTVRETLPEGFQRSEFLLERGAIDRIVARPEMRDTLHAMLAMLLKCPTKPVKPVLVKTDRTISEKHPQS